MFTKTFASIFTTSIALVASLAATLAVTSAQSTQSAQSPPPLPSPHGIALASMDTSITPGDDFYHYANGNWIAHATIPSHLSSVSVFRTLIDLTNKRTAGLIEDAAKHQAPAASDQRKIADLYNSYMDDRTIESRGLAPLRPRLDAITALKDKRELARALGESLRADVDALNNTKWDTPNFLGLWVTPGFNDPAHYAAYLLQGGLQLPQREYYISDSESMRTVRDAYLRHISTMLKLAGFTDPDARAHRVLDLERAIAEKHLSLEESEDVHKANNTWRRPDFPAKAPGMDWDEYFRGANLMNQQEFIVWQPSAVAGQVALVASIPLESWKDLLAYHTIEFFADVLPKPFADAQFDFFHKTLLGVSQPSPRWQHAVEIVNDQLGDAVGKIYADRFFSQQAKAQVQAMVSNIVAALGRRIAALTWMSPETKSEAQAKLANIYVGVGYPEVWKNYSSYEVKSEDIFGNIDRGSLFEYHRAVARLGLPVDRKEWSMTPQLVNAADLPIQDALSFPAAILQPPFFDPEAPAAVNYGAIGTVIGHEISHMFDMEGAAFDHTGRLRNWWTPADLAHFNAATAVLARQYDAYQPIPGVHINGQQTISENIADVAGLASAYDAYHASLTGTTAASTQGNSAAGGPVAGSTSSPNAGLNGDLTNDQQFFIAFAQNWAEKQRPAALRHELLTDFHAPGEYRAFTVRNIDAWYTAFHVQPGQQLYLAPASRVRIW
jgi:putative endopeptidase